MASILSARFSAPSPPEALHEARISLRRAQYDRVLDLLCECEDWPHPTAEQGILLKAETLGRRDPADALVYLGTVDDMLVTNDGRFGQAVETARFLAASRDLERAAHWYRHARTLAATVPFGEQTLAYHLVRMRWFQRDCDPDAPEIAIALVHPDPSIVAATYAYRGWLHAGRGEYRAQIRDFQRVLACRPVDDLPIDLATVATTVHALARVAFEIADDEGVETARTAFDAIRWTADVDLERFGTIRALGWDAFMRGQAARAQWAFRDAKSLAPSTAWQVILHLDRAYVARIARNEVWALEELTEADRLAHDVAWESTFGEERQALVMLAALHAQSDAGRAMRYAARYAQLGVENVNPALAIAGDRRTTAAQQYAQGLIELAFGRRAAALPTLFDAYEIYASASHHYRATLVAIALAEVTGEARWSAASRMHASRYPNCPLAAMADEAAARHDSLPSELTPFQRQLARAVWTGVENAELSRRFSRSLYTIEREIGRICRAFGVADRDELREHVRRLGLQ
ncbi:MAG: hypothetical protein JOZ24_03110 [Candidatus Eremiobacteraeota bacterium]|nr:hypothetical protein [Candidatus Eremiobacteraeota bacterium]